MLPLSKVHSRSAASQVPKDLPCASGAGHPHSQSTAKPLGLLALALWGASASARLGSSPGPGLVCGSGV